ncbi:MAG: hypothetical protein R3F14_20990 [Polyangiaceae bacterium]
MTDLLRRALRLIAAAQPTASAELAASLEGISLAITISGEPDLTLSPRGGALLETPPPLPSATPESGGRLTRIGVRTDRAMVRKLVSGHTTLTQAIRSGAVDLRGTTAALTTALGAFEIFVGALLRTDDADQLREELERDR